jgi:predicted porin
MKKSLIALAVLAVSGAASAQSSVTLYGVVDTSIAYESGATLKGNSSWTGIQNNGNVNSRLGFKGSEDLGGGLKANFVLEAHLKPDTGAMPLSFGRQSTVGLSGNFGEVRLGRELTAAYNATSRYDVMGQAGYGASHLWRDFFLDSRVNNAVTYVSPNFSGLVASLNYGFGEDKDYISGKYSNSANRYVGTGITYDNGPLSLGLALEQLNKGSQTLGNKTSAWSLGGSYNLGVVKLAAAYRESKLNRDNLGPQMPAWDLKQKGLMLGISAPVGTAGEIRASWNHYRDINQFEGEQKITLKANALALGYVHNLSKRTALYGTVAYMKNKNAGVNGQPLYLGLALDTSNTFIRDNGSQRAMQIGIRHAF